MPMTAYIAARIEADEMRRMYSEDRPFVVGDDKVCLWPLRFSPLSYAADSLAIPLRWWQRSSVNSMPFVTPRFSWDISVVWILLVPAIVIIVM